MYVLNTRVFICISSRIVLPLRSLSRSICLSELYTSSFEKSCSPFISFILNIHCISGELSSSYFFHSWYGIR